MAQLVPPHGGKGLTTCLLEGAELEAEKTKAEGLKKSDFRRVKGDLIMIGIGGFSPLTGFMTKADWKGVCENFLMADGTFWPVPVCLDVTKKTPPASTSVTKSPSSIPKATKSWPP
jgi:sulfate adenylyltransferase